MANQTGVVRGRYADGTPFEGAITIVDTDETLATLGWLGGADAFSVPQDLVLYDLLIPANTATITQVQPLVNGNRMANKTLQSVFLANATTVPATRFGQPLGIKRGATLQFIAT